MTIATLQAVVCHMSCCLTPAMQVNECLKKKRGNIILCKHLHFNFLLILWSPLCVYQGV